MQGRKPTPTVLHEIRGTSRRKRHTVGRAAEPVAPGALPDEPPEWLTEAQRADWEYAVKYAPIGVLKQADRTMLAVWVEAVDTHRNAMIAQNKQDAGSEHPLLVRMKKANGEPGELIVSPYIGIARRASLAIIKAGSELGFSPASRPRLAQRVSETAEKTSSWGALHASNDKKAA